MANTSFHLFQLQKIDLQIDQTVLKIKKINDTLANNPVLKAADLKVSQTKELLHKKTTELKQVEETAHTKQIKIEQSESSLYKGTISNPKELNDLQAEIASLKKLLSQIEENQLALMSEVEEIESKLAKASDEYDAVFKAAELDNGKLIEDRKNLLHNNEKLALEREVALKQISAESIAVYEKLRAAKNRIAVTDVVDEACSTCGSEITAANIQKAKTSATLSFCSGCGRILYTG